MIQKQFSSSLSRQSSETKPRTKLVLVSREPLLYLEFNKPNQQNVSEIDFFKKFNFLKSDKINTQPCFPMRMFKAQQRAK